MKRSLVWLTSTVLLMLALGGCANRIQQVEEVTPVLPESLLTLEELTYLFDNTRTSSICQSVVNTVSEIKGSVVHVRYQRGSPTRPPFGKYHGIQTADDCLFFMDVPLETETPLGEPIQIKGLISALPDTRNPDFLLYVIDPSMQKKPACPEEPTCPIGKQVVSTKRYTGGRMGGCPFQWECK